MMGHHNDKVLARKAFGVMYTVPEIKPAAGLNLEIEMWRHFDTKQKSK